MSQVTRAWITETCIANHGAEAAVEEALHRLRVVALEVLEGHGRPFKHKLHFVLDLERAGSPLFHPTPDTSIQASEPVESGRVYWFLETVAAPPRYLVSGRPGFPAHLTTDPLQADRFTNRPDAIARCCNAAIRVLIGEELAAVEHMFMEPPAKEHVEITVNARAVFVTFGEPLTYERLVELSGLSGNPSMTYFLRIDGDEARGGSLSWGKSIVPEPGMRFNVAHTGNA